MAPVAFSPHFHLLTTLGYLSGIWAGNCLIMGWRCDLTCSGGIGWDEWREERVRWRAFRVQWEDERCWRQIKADGDADKTVREAKAFILHSQYTHTHTHTEVVHLHFKLAVAWIFFSHLQWHKDTFARTPSHFFTGQLWLPPLASVFNTCTVTVHKSRP